MHAGQGLAFTKMICFLLLCPEKDFNPSCDFFILAMSFNSRINHLNNTMPEIYTPHKELSLDESMMLLKDRLVFRQYIKNKRHNYGVKFFELCTDDGLVFEIQICSGTKFTDTESLEQTGSIVLHLMEPYLNKDYNLFTDNWYNSVSLTEYMLKRNTYITGTLRGDRKRNPSQVVGKKLRKGEMVFMSLGDISVTK